MPTLEQQRAALAETCTSLADLADTLDAEQWALPTGCPGWTVFDQVAHVASLEHVMAGGDEPSHTAPPAAYVRNSIGTRMEGLVDRRRGRPPAELVAELRAVVDRRAAQLAALGADALLPGPTGKPTPLPVHLGMRVFDCAAHEQDVRRAVGRPGGLDGEVGAVLAEQLPQLLTRVWDRPVALVVDGRRTVVGDGEPGVTLACDLATLVARTSGRSDAGPVEVVAGDPATAAALVAAMGVTP